MRLFLISLFIFILILSGMATFNGVLISLAIPLVVYLGFALFYFPQTVKISIERAIRPVRVHKGETVFVTLSIKNTGADQQ